MHRKGHIGVTLLVFAPAAYLLVGDGKLALAVVAWLGIQAVEPLPDQDFHLPGLTHRGVSHSLLAVLVVGGVLGAGGWLLGDRLFDLLYGVLAAGGALWGWLLAHLPDLSAAVLADLAALGPSVTPRESVTALQQQAGGHVDRRTFALFGFGIGVYGVGAHLLGDVITTRGIQPLLPVARWRFSLSSLRADSPTANTALFFLGVLAVVVVLGTAGLGGGADVPGAVSPVGVAAGQTQTQTPMPNQSAPSIEVVNQTSNGSAVTIERVTLPDGGFVALHDSDYLGPAPASSSIIAVSPYLAAGSHRNVTIAISHAPPGNYPGLNRSRLNASQRLVGALYRDTNTDERFAFVRSVGADDGPYTRDGQAVTDTAAIDVPSAETKRRIATVTVENQTLQNGTLVVERARLPDGGFVVAHNTTYRRTGDPLPSVAGVSAYLSPGNHTNISIQVRPRALSGTQVVTLRPTKDTNDNQQYDYVQSGGLHDTGYPTANRSATVTTTALIRIPAATTPGRTPTTAIRPPTTATQPLPTTSSATVPPPTPPAPTTPPPPTTATPPDADGANTSSGLLGALGLGQLVAAVTSGPVWFTGVLVVVVVAGGLTLIGRWT